MRRAVTIALLAAFSLYVGWRFAWPYIDTRPEQDACEFGSVSNARYRELLAEAKRRSATVWPPLRGSTERQEKARLLSERIDDLSSGAKTLFERFAAIHAVMRERGGYLVKAQVRMSRFPTENPDGIDIDSALQHQFVEGAALSASYFMHSNHAGHVEGWIDPIFPEIGINVELKGRATEISPPGQFADVTLARTWNEVRVSPMSVVLFLMGIQGKRLIPLTQVRLYVVGAAFPPGSRFCVDCLA